MNPCDTLTAVPDDVSNFDNALPNIFASLTQGIEVFQAGRLSNFMEKWKGLTNDHEILDMVRGANIDFEHLTVQTRPPAKFSETETNIIDTENTRLLNKKVSNKKDLQGNL